MNETVSFCVGSCFAVIIFYLCFFDQCKTVSCVILSTSVEKLKQISLKESDYIHTICGKSFENLKDGRRYPWAISITQNGQNKLGGTIISSYHILTVAHGFINFFFQSRSYAWSSEPNEPCQFNGYRHFDNRIVAFGDDCIRVQNTTNLINNETFKRFNRRQTMSNHNFFKANNLKITCNTTKIQFNKIRAVYVDDKFANDGCLNGHDWAIIEVEEKINFTNAVQPICLPLEEDNRERTLRQNQELTVVGWGRPDAFSEASPLIHNIFMRYDAECVRPWSDQMPSLVSDYLCAKALKPFNYDSPRTCHGDSGTGIAIRDEYDRGVLLGITSYGSHGCPSNELVRFTRVSKYLRRICLITGLCYPVKL